MTQFADIPQQGGFFKPADHLGAVAILLEVQGFQAQAPSKYGPKDSVTAEITVFKTQTDLDSGNATELGSVAIQYKGLTRGFEGLVGKATIAALGQAPTQSGQDAWVWRQVGSAASGKVAEYVQKRDAAREAAKANIPSFLS